MMKIFETSVVRIKFATVRTDHGEFKVCEDGTVLFWHDELGKWMGESWIIANWYKGDEMIEAVRDSGEKIL